MPQRFSLAPIFAAPGLTVALLVGCGQKGPLYLPQDAAQPAAPTTIEPTTHGTGKEPTGTGLQKESEGERPSPMGPVTAPMDSTETDIDQADMPEQEEVEK
ncbi:LPS translocon maturation chaperone LptM [Microbulbifer sediminum]|uniref:LPS translocon maturation chaperone LptM n=1 Tax=Microbulbifer sediminum TaxID=2904250 RepID=UPI001F194063|nr:lipoprotein [Microbulbifer sediminum]